MYYRRLRCIVITLLASHAFASHSLAQPVEWDSVYFHRSLNFRQIDFADRNICGAVGTEASRKTVLLVTTDRGLTWQRKIIGDFAVTRYLPAEPYDVANPSAGTFIVSADSGIVCIRLCGSSRSFPLLISP